MTTKATATLNVEVNVNCPECDHYIDLMADTDLNDDCWLLRQVAGSGKRWGCDDLEKEVTCPDCKHRFKVGQVDW